MERRELLKALAVMPFTRLPFKDKDLPAVEVAPHKYWGFVDVNAFKPEAFAGPWPWPGCDAEIFAVRRPPGMTVQDAIAIYKIADDTK